MCKISHFSDCNQENSEKFHFSPVKNFKLEARTDAMSLSSHGGLLLLQQEEEHLSLASQLASCIEDKRILRDEADIIVTNPPFSLFREFVVWLIESGKKFAIIGNVNAISYKEVFPLIKDNKMWMGVSIHSGDREFGVPDTYPLEAPGWRIDENGNKYIRVKGVRWFTNIDHGRRHEPLQLMTMAKNFKHSKHKEIRGQKDYVHYENYDAIDIPFTDAIPSDYEGAMGVPITFLDKYCPEQFESIGHPHGDYGLELGLKPYPRELKELNKGLRDGDLYYMKDGKPELPYRRILIRKKQSV